MLGKVPGRDIQVVGYDNYWYESPTQEFSSFAPVASVDKTELQDRTGNGKPPSGADFRTASPDPQLVLVKPELVVTGNAKTN